MIKGKVENQEIEWLSYPRGLQGVAQVKVNGGAILEVKWTKDAYGIFLELPHGVFAFDLLSEVESEVESEMDSSERTTYEVKKRASAESYGGLCFLKMGEAALPSSLNKRKRGKKIKAQMPGKIVRILVKSGDEVITDQPLIVMEAMKMENQIRSLHHGKINQVLVAEGQAVETGAELLILE